MAVRLDEEDGLAKGFAGTRPYMAPEVFRKERLVYFILFYFIFFVLFWFCFCFCFCLFDVAVRLDEEDGLAKGFAGTRPYMAPEVFRKERLVYYYYYYYYYYYFLVLFFVLFLFLFV